MGSEGKYIEKIIADERTNSLIVMANDEAMSAVVALISELDVDVDPASRAKIHVVYLEHAKSEDVASVLSNLAESGRSNDRSSRRARSRRSPAGPGNARGAAAARGGADAEKEGVLRQPLTMVSESPATRIRTHWSSWPRKTSSQSCGR